MVDWCIQALLNTSSHDEISETSEIELSRDEDSITSLAVAHASAPTASSASGGSVIALAGLNSCLEEQKRGNNQHLRSFQIDLPRKADEEAKAKGKGKGKKGTAARAEDQTKTTIKVESSLLSRASLFRTKVTKPEPDTYQRIVRTSPWRRREENGQDDEEPRVAAITTGLAPSGEMVFFQATQKPSEADVIGRIQLGEGEEAEDVDLIDLAVEEDSKGKKNSGHRKFRVAYTNGIDVFTCQISSGTRANTSPEVNCVYTTPLPEKGAKKSRPKFRALRFLSPTALLLLQNAPDRTGCELLVLELPSPTDQKKSKQPETSIIRRKKLRKAMKIGLGLAVCNLGSSGPDTQHRRQQQTIIAVTGSDQSIELLTLDHESGRKGNERQECGHIRPYHTLRDVHPFSVTSICFSNFIVPSSRTTDSQGQSQPQQQQQQQQQQQHVKLASVSMGNTVVVNTLPLTPIPAATGGSHRYVLAVPETWSNLGGLSALTILVLLIGILLQGILELRGDAPTHLGVGEWVPFPIRDLVLDASHDPLRSTPPAVTTATTTSTSTTTAATITAATDDDENASLSSPSVTATTTISVVPNPNIHIPRQTLRDILLARQESPKSILVRCSEHNNEVFIETVPLSQHVQDEQSVKPWGQLADDQRALWRQRLINTGHWTIDGDEDILTGVLFREYREFVGEQ